MATIGDTTAPSTNTTYYDALFTTTLMAHRRTMVDNIFKEKAFLAYLKMAGAKSTQDGGERVAIPLMYGDNDTVATHGGYSLIDTTPQEGMTTAFCEWAEIAGSISISRREQRQNSGEGRLLNLLEKKTEQAQMTMAEKLNNDMVQGTVNTATFVPDQAEDGTYGVLPLGYWFPKANGTDPVAGGNCGNIARSNPWWRHRTAIGDTGTAETGNSFALNITTYAGMKVALRRLYYYCARGTGGAPDLGILDQVTYETYENALDQSVRYMNTKMADMGFDNIKLKGATLLWDEQVPDVEAGTVAITKGTAWLLNTKFYGLMVDSETDIVTTPFIEPENQTAKTAKVLFMGNTWVSNMRKHGVLYALGQAIVS